MITNIDKNQKSEIKIQVEVEQTRISEKKTQR